MSENKINSWEEEFKAGMEESRRTGKPYFTAQQKQLLENLPESCVFFDDDDKVGSVNGYLISDCMISLKREKQGFFKRVWIWIKSIFGFKDKSTVIYVQKNRNSNGSGAKQFEANFKIGLIK